MKDVMLVGGGRWQIDMLRYLQSKGHKVWIVNPLSTSTTDAADYWIREDTRHFQVIEERIRSLGLQLQFITSDQSDVGAYSAAVLSQNFGLRGNKPEAVNRFFNKLAMYKFAEKIGVPVAPFAACSCTEDVKAFGREYGFPIVVKPADGTASRGFSKVDNMDGVSKSVEKCRQFTTNQDFVVQKFVPGTEYTVEGIASGYKHKSLTASRKQHFRTGIARRLQYPGDIPDVVYESNNKFVEESGLRFAITHAEYMVNEHGYFLMEIAARGGGVSIASDIIRLTTGIDILYDIIYNELCGGVPFDVSKLEPARNHVALQFFEFPIGEVVSFDEIPKLPGIFRFEYNFKLNSFLQPALTDSQRHSYAIVTGDTVDILEANITAIREALRVCVK